jgi:hypothetical protein
MSATRACTGLPEASCTLTRTSALDPGRAVPGTALTFTASRLCSTLTASRVVPTAYCGRPRSVSPVAPATFTRPETSATVTCTPGRSVSSSPTSSTCTELVSRSTRWLLIPFRSTVSRPTARSKGLFTSTLARSPAA